MVVDRTLRCACCGTPIAEVRHDGAIVIESRHHGQRHTSVLPLDTLRRLCDTEPVVEVVVIGRTVVDVD
jgi:hypothetical protein